jgi:hypothetical protein
MLPWTLWISTSTTALDLGLTKRLQRVYAVTVGKRLDASLDIIGVIRVKAISLKALKSALVRLKWSGSSRSSGDSSLVLRRQRLGSL